MCRIILVIKRGARNTITLQAPCGYFRGKQVIMVASPQLTSRHLSTRPLETRIIIKRGAWNTVRVQALCGYFRGKQVIMATSPQLTSRHLLTRPLESRIIIKRGAWNTITLQAPCGYFRGKQVIMATSPQLTSRPMSTGPLEIRVWMLEDGREPSKQVKRSNLQEEGLAQLVIGRPSVWEILRSIPRCDHKSFFPFHVAESSVKYR